MRSFFVPTLSVALSLSFACSGSTSSDSNAGTGAVNGAAGNGGTGGAAGSSGAASGGSGAAGGSGATGGSGAGAGGTGGAGGGNAGAGGVDDPPPVEPDLSGLVETSSHYIVFTEGAVPRLSLIELDNATIHELSAPGDALAYVTSSPDAHAVFYSGANAASDANLALARLTDHGFVPAVLTDGFAGTPANHYIGGWTHDARFALFSRGSNLAARGVDVIDIALNRRHAAFDVAAENSYAFVSPAASGYWFLFGGGGDAISQTSIARITDDGASEPTAFDDDQVPQFIDRVGTHLIWGKVITRERYQFFSRDLASGADTEIVVDIPGEDCGASSSFPGDPASLMAFCSLAEDHNQVIGHRVWIDGSRAPVQLTASDRLLNYVQIAADASMMLVSYADATEQQVEWADTLGGPHTPLASLPNDGVSRLDIGALGSRHMYYALNNTEIHLLALEAGNLVDTKLNEPGEAGFDCAYTNGSVPPPPDKLVYTQSGTRSFVMFDISSAVPTRVGSEPFGEQSLIGCPVWSTAGDAFAYIEQTNPTSTMRLVRWSGAAPEPAEVVATPDEAVIEIVVVSP